jgi:hypothetical protein
VTGWSFRAQSLHDLQRWHQNRSWK